MPRIGDAEPHRDDTLQHPRCVFQILRRHFARYTPEMVERVCGVPSPLFDRVCRTVADSSGRDRTTAFAYAVGWTQHTVGVQYIRTAAILQLLLGNIGRPGGGILALRGHASIQGSTDIPTLFDLLPGYIPMPHAHVHQDLQTFVEAESAHKGFWGETKAYLVSLLKAWWGAAAGPENEFCFDFLPRLTGSHSTYETLTTQLDGTCTGFFVMGENPAVGSANARMQRLAMAKLEWLVVRDFSLIESATWWKDGPEIESGELRTADIATEVFFLPAAAHTEKDGSFTNTQRLLQWHHAAVEPAGDARSELWFTYHLGRIIREKLASSTDPMDDPSSGSRGTTRRGAITPNPTPTRCWQEINGRDADGHPAVGLHASCTTTARRRAGAGSTAVFAPAARTRPPAARRAATRVGSRPNGVGRGPPTAACSTTGRLPIPTVSRGASGRPTCGGTRTPTRGQATTCPISCPTSVPTTSRHRTPLGRPRSSGRDPFIMQGDGKAWFFAPAGLVDGPLPTALRAAGIALCRTCSTAQQRNPVRQLSRRGPQRPVPSDRRRRRQRRVPVRRHDVPVDRAPHRRWACRAGCRTSPSSNPRCSARCPRNWPAERGLEHLGWATIVTARNAIEARVLVTERMSTLTVDGRTVHQVGLPYHWGPNGYTTGDAANELVPPRPRSQRSHSRGQGHDVRHPARSAARAAPPALVPLKPRGYHRHIGPASPDETGLARVTDETTRVGFFTDTSVCIGCKACEVACKEWNQCPRTACCFTGMSYDNSRASVPTRGATSPSSNRATRWRHDTGGDELRWLMSSDVCKHCTHAACLDVCPTGSLFRTEFGTVVVQEDICNGCGYCIPACPFGVIDQRQGRRSSVEVHALLRPVEVGA